MLYYAYEMQRASIAPLRAMASHALTVMDLPFNPLRQTPIGKVAAAALDSFEHTTRPFGKPEFGHKEVEIDGEIVPISEQIVLSKPWGDLLRFRRHADRPQDRKVLMVAPISGHFATLLRGTVEAFLPDHDVYITDWRDARAMPLMGPEFDLNDYIDYVIEFIRFLGPETHVIAVCQPAVPVMAAVSLLNAGDKAAAPVSMSLIGGPIDTREGATAVNAFAKSHNLDWFKRNVIHRVPFGNPLEAKRRFYEEYRSVMDMSAEYYLQTIHAVFHEHLLPRGLFKYRDERVDPSAITRTAIQTIEGERDDISGIGQTKSAHILTPHLAADRRMHWEQPGVGHYGLFNGRRFNADVAPRIKAFIQAQG